MKVGFKRMSWHQLAIGVTISGLLLGYGQTSTSAPSSNPAASTTANTTANPTTATAAAGPKGAAQVNTTRIIGADSEPGNWLAHGRTYSEQRFSPLNQINKDNVATLGLSWYWDTGTTRGLEATPIVVDGTMYTTGSWSIVQAHDAVTGKLLWQFDPKVDRKWGRFACCDVVNRGVAVYGGNVYVGTIDGRLVALQAASGKKVWDVSTIDPNRPYTITGAPRVLKDKVIIGNGGAEYGVRGYVTAYDTATGKQAWRFYTVPGDPSLPAEGDHMKKAMPTWLGGKWWEVGGGGTVWDSMAYDPALNLLYIGVGNGAPWNRFIRSPGGGDNLYLSSIVAVNPDTGKYVWHYQTTPGDQWDYTATQHMILADIDIGGERRKVIMQAPKNGFFYVLDRTNGEFISAEAYVPVSWADRVDPETGRPIEKPGARYANKTTKIRPGPLGGHNWQPMSFSPRTGLVYIPALDLSFKYAQDNAFKYNKETWNPGVDFDATIPTSDPDQMVADLGDVRGHLAAWDPVAQKELWRVQHVTSWNGGVVSTAGDLVFQGRADGSFSAYSAIDGTLLWEFPVGMGIIAAPVTYQVNGKQYVAVMAGWGGAFVLTGGVPRHRQNFLKEGRLLVFELGGTAKLPAPAVTWMALSPPPPMKKTDAQVAAGASLYHANCSVCHGAGVVGSGPIPDLRYASAATHKAWDAIVLGGAYQDRGMASFAHVLDQKKSTAIHAYVIAAIEGSIGLCQSAYRKNYPELLETACVQPIVAAAAKANPAKPANNKAATP